MFIDTGSANTWFGTKHPYAKSKTSRRTGNQVKVEYGDGTFYGDECECSVVYAPYQVYYLSEALTDIDAVTITNTLTVQSQSIGAARRLDGVDRVANDGMLGLGPAVLTRKTVSKKDQVPTIIDTLYKEHRMPWPAVGVAFAPYGVVDGGAKGKSTGTHPNNKRDMGADPGVTLGGDSSHLGARSSQGTQRAQIPGTPNGVLTFGGYDRSRFTGQLSWVPLTAQKPAKAFWGLDQSLVYDGKTIMKQSAGILDTGTTLIYLATGACMWPAQLQYEMTKSLHHRCIQEVSGGYRSYERPEEWDASHSQLSVQCPQATAIRHRKTDVRTPSQRANMASSQEGLHCSCFLSEASVFLVAYVMSQGAQDGYVYLVINDLERLSGSGLDFVNGFVWSERFYSVYDTGNKGVWIGNSKHVDSTTN
jgi:saccharopepsin